jgi:hypothetical protein
VSSWRGLSFAHLAAHIARRRSRHRTQHRTDVVLPLHQLLEAQEGLDGTITGRMEAIMQSLGTIAASLQTTAEALTQNLDQEASVSSLAEAMQKMEVLMHRQALAITAIDQNMRLLIDWLGAPLPRAAGPNS